MRLLNLVQSASSSALVLLCVYVLHKGRLERPRFCLTAVGRRHQRHSPTRRCCHRRGPTRRHATAAVAVVVPRESMNGACFHSWNRRRHCRRHHRRRRCCCYDDTLWPWLLVGHKLQRPAHAISRPPRRHRRRLLFAPRHRRRPRIVPRIPTAAVRIVRVRADRVALSGG